MPANSKLFIAVILQCRSAALPPLMSSIIVHVQAYSIVRVKTFYENKSVYTHTL